jgi:Cation/multidrug efflux pump
MYLSNVSTKRPVLITVLFIASLLIGFYCYHLLPINDMPEADLPFVTVSIVEQGASADQIENKISQQVEDAVGQISGIDHITTNVKEGVSTTIIQFELDKAPDTAAQEVRDKISSIRSKLPSDIEDPVIVKFDPTAKPILSLAVTGTDHLYEMSQYIEDHITNELYQVSGVGGVNLYGNTEHEVQVRLDRQKLQAYSISTTEVVNSLKSDNLDIPSGSVSDRDTEIGLRTNSDISDVREFSNVLIAKRNGTEIRLRDIASITDGYKDAETLCHYKGQNAIGIDIIQQSGANTVKTAESVKKTIAELQQSLPEGMHIAIVRDNSTSIHASVNDVMKTIVEGCILAVLIVFLFLKEWQSTLICAVSLPSSIIITFISMKLMDFSLNTLSLLALSLAVGLLIDDAIVVIENIIRHLHAGASPLEAAKAATSEISQAVLATTLSVVSVFLPVAMVSGVIGKYFKEFGLTVAFSMMVSLLVSFTLVPMISSRLLKPDQKLNIKWLRNIMDRFNEKFDKITQQYGNALRLALSHRKSILLIGAVLFVLSLCVTPALGYSFLPSTDMSELNISIDTDPGWTIEKSNQSAILAEKRLAKNPDILYTYTTVEDNFISIYAKLTDKTHRSKSAQELCKEVRKELSPLTGVQLSVNSPSIGVGESKDVTFNLVGTDRETLSTFAEKAAAKMKKDPHAADVSLNYKPGNPELSIDIDRDAAADLGVNASIAANTVRTLYNGTNAGTFDNGNDRYDITVSLQDSQKQGVEGLQGVYVPNSSNQMIPLSQITKVSFRSSPSELHRYDRKQEIQLSANVIGTASGDFIKEYKDILNNKMSIPKDVQVSMGGFNQSMQEGFVGLLVALAAGILFIYLVMAAQFESFLDPISILLSMPFAMSGAILGLLVSGNELSIVALIGIIMLMGLVAKNAILLVDFAKQATRRGTPCREALIEAGRIRLRPILMTTLAMIFGMLPLAIANGTGSELRAPMAYAVIGGLITSTLLTLFVVPISYSLLDDWKTRRKKIS